MRSIRTKIAVLTVVAIIAAMGLSTLIGAAAVSRIDKSSSEELLFLLCETGEKNLDAYFESVEQSVGIVSSYVTGDIDGLDEASLAAHTARVRDIFDKTAVRTSGVLTYYYRIDPAVSETVKGFWYTDLDGTGFTEHEVTDITQYDTADTSRLVWFTVPKHTGEAIWLPPYITENLDVRVISYNVPIYYSGTFVGVVGIEIDYSTMAKQVDMIKLYENGYAFINDAEGNLVYHPRIDVPALSPDEIPRVPEGLLKGETGVRYIFEGVERQAARLRLSNGMVLNVSVPVSEINSARNVLLIVMIAAAAVLLAVFVVLTLRLSGHITKPLRRLTRAAEEVDKGNYSVEIDASGNDEVGILARTFKKLIGNLKIQIEDLSSLAYADALTSVHNKGAFDIYVRELQNSLSASKGELEFAIGIFDCDRLKHINDSFGHEKGDFYIKASCRLICRTFSHSPVFRTGGDEFAVILQKDDYRNRDELTEFFVRECEKTCSASENVWEQVRVSMGVAVYDRTLDITVSDVVRRADQLMYDNKRYREEPVTPSP